MTRTGKWHKRAPALLDWLLLLWAAGAIVYGFVDRFTGMGERPVHADEAVQGMKFIRLLEQGEYRYDPTHFHGPTLYYLALPVAWARGETDSEAISVETLRTLPALSGLLLIAVPWLFRRECGWRFALIATGLLSIVPGLVYYQTYFVQEALFLAFAALSAGLGFRFLRDGGYRWGLPAGLCLGLLISTKESWPLVGVAIAAGMLVAVRPGRDGYRMLVSRLGSGPFFAGLAVTVGTVALFYSSFGSHPAGLIDFFRAFAAYELDPAHDKEADYYLEVIAKLGIRPAVWPGEFALVLTALTGGLVLTVHRFWRKAGAARMAAGSSVSALLLFGVYSSIAYKTPWLMLTPLAFWAFGGAAAAGAMIGSGRTIGRFAGLAGLLLLTGMLIDESHWVNQRFPVDARNPYAYVPTTYDARALGREIRERASENPGRFRIVVAAENYWPLPWYWRDLDEVGYFSRVPERWPDADLYVVTPEMARTLYSQRGEPARGWQIRGLRPGVLVLVLEFPDGEEGRPPLD